MSNDILAILAVTDIFDSLDDTQLELIASICEPAVYQPGHILMQEHDHTQELYIIGRGGVEILMSPGFVGTQAEEDSVEPVVLTELRQGQVVGEVALVDQGIRSATARISQKDTYLLRVERARLMKLCDNYPGMGYKIMKNLAADLALKIRNTDLTVRQYQLLLAKAG
jgi:CRP/FNR family transcriptional regulator, cyclic AMP receptor protein